MDNCDDFPDLTDAELQQAAAFVVPEETGFGDPLEDCETFNILQFVNDEDTPVNSPAVPMPNLPHQQQHQQQRQHGMNPNNNINNVANGLLYQRQSGNTRLPDSPPITDVSGAGSSGSPSSSSDGPYSPEQYLGYPGLPGNVANNAMILNMMQQELGGQLLSPEMLNQMQQQHGQRLMQQQQLSPNSDFLSYPPQSTPGSHQSQLSPPALNQRQMNQMNFGMPQQNFPLDMFSNEDLGLGLEAPGQKRRRVSDNLPLVKSEHDPRMYPMAQSTRAPSVASINPMGSSMDEYDENGINQRQIRFAPFAVENWSALYDCTQQELAPLTVNVVADKGFNYSPTDACFVNQKKNHFQVTVHIEAIHDNPPYYVRAANGELLPITEFSLAFCGAKAEMPTSEIQIRQSQTDRKPIPHDPVKLNIAPRQLTKVTVPRLHFSETTMNNHRKNGRPNPEQKFFLLIVKLIASTPNGPMLVQAYQSDRVIVRASNPGQFEPPESDVAWQRNGGTLHYGGPVAIGTDKPLPDAQLTVLGNIVSTGQTTRPSDRRVKEDIVDVDTQDALARLNQVRIVEYNYKPEIAQQWGMNDDERHRVGVIAQELAEVIPDAVRDNGEFLTVDDTRIFYDTVAAAQELYRLTGNLECKIDQVEKISAKLARFAQKRRQFGSMASGITDISGLLGSGGGLDNKSLSYSRTSLASAPAGGSSSRDRSSNKKRRDSNHGCGRSQYCQRSEPSLCSSKVTQGTIITLVVVMALCLMAMCTLYVMDWYNRNYVHQNIYHPLIVPATPGPYDLDNIMQLGNRSGPMEFVPPAQPRAPPLTATCGKASSCPQYCCAAQPTTHEGWSYEDDISVVGKPTKGPEIRKRSVTTAGEHSPLESGVSIEVIDFNATLDERYCVNGSCVARRGLYNLYVPVAGQTPTAPVLVRFSISGDRYLDSCGSLLDFQHKACQFDYNFNINHAQEPLVTRISDDVYELSAGHFFQSAYRFRVSYAPGACHLNESEQGLTFEEYNLVFYRRCDGANSTA